MKLKLEEVKGGEMERGEMEGQKSEVLKMEREEEEEIERLLEERWMMEGTEEAGMRKNLKNLKVLHWEETVWEKGRKEVVK